MAEGSWGAEAKAMTTTANDGGEYPEDRLIGTLVRGRIAQLDTQRQQVEVYISLARQAELLKSLRPNMSHLSPLAYRDLDVAALKKEEDMEKKLQISQAPRLLNVPHVGNWNHDQAVNQLRATAAVGICVIRTVENTNDELRLYVKVRMNPFLWKEFDIKELHQPKPGVIGRSLRMGDREYKNTDAIVNDFVKKFKNNLEEVYNDRKFTDKGRSEALQELRQQHQNMVQPIICWCLCIDMEHPGQFLLLQLVPTGGGAIAGRQHVMLEDRVIVTHEGFYLWGHREEHLKRLVDWWKREGFKNRSTHCTNQDQSGGLSTPRV
eukprot:GHVU01039120.1.p1 GENE.GHVU01039120.1~~GHVU01039120.1.p1  ORF type:complete len:367 (-),score=87.74 GHVU01039120.1:239-1201(-)